MLLYLGIQLVESYFLMPMLQGRTVCIAVPGTDLCRAGGDGVWVGGIGLVLATPLTAVLLVLVQRLYVDAVLQDGHERRAGDGGAA